MPIFSLEIVPMNECVESILYMIFLGHQLCQLIGLGTFWLVSNSVHAMCSFLSADYQGVLLETDCLLSLLIASLSPFLLSDTPNDTSHRTV